MFFEGSRAERAHPRSPQQLSPFLHFRTRSFLRLGGSSSQTHSHRPRGTALRWGWALPAGGSGHGGSPQQRPSLRGGGNPPEGSQAHSSPRPFDFSRQAGPDRTTPPPPTCAGLVLGHPVVLVAELVGAHQLLGGPEEPQAQGAQRLPGPAHPAGSRRQGRRQPRDATALTGGPMSARPRPPAAGMPATPLAIGRDGADPQPIPAAPGPRWRSGVEWVYGTAMLGFISARQAGLDDPVRLRRAESTRR